MANTAQTVQDALNTFLGTITGVTTNPGVLALMVEQRNLPACIGYLKAYEPDTFDTGNVRITATYAVDIHLSPDPAAFVAQAATVVPDIALALYKLDTVGGEDVREVRDLGEPRPLGLDGMPTHSMLKQLEVVVEWEEAL